MLLDPAPRYARARPMPPHFSPAIDCPGGCFICRYFGHRVDFAAWCARPSGEQVRSQAERGCAFWDREPGADYELPEPRPPPDIASSLVSPKKNIRSCDSGLRQANNPLASTPVASSVTS